MEALVNQHTSRFCGEIIKKQKNSRATFCCLRVNISENIKEPVSI